MGRFYKLFTANPDELSRMVDVIRKYQEKSDAALTKELEQAKQKQTETIQILKGEQS